MAPQFPVFHPKVTIVRQKDNSCFAIVGSGNLTGGGQLHNIECAVYVDDKLGVQELRAWYDYLIAKPLSSRIIEAYRPVYERAGNLKDKAVSPSSELAAALNDGYSDWYEDIFLNEMTDFLSTQTGATALEGRISGAKRIHDALGMSLFNFKQAGWAEFYGTWDFGRIRQA